MNSFRAQHQKWPTLPSVADISVKLPASLTDDLLAFGNRSASWLTAPNSLIIDKTTNLEIHSSHWKTQLEKAPGALRLQLESYYSDDELRLLYALVSRSFGYLNNRYTYFFDVQDRGLDYTKEAIPVSKTKAETGYHTDSTSKNYFPDYVGLLCLQPAVEGGESLVTNAANLLEFLIENHPHLNALLNQPLYRDVITPGTVQNLDAIRNNDIPLFQFDSEGGVIFRYMRYWIESALLKLNEMAPTHLQEALNTIDDFFARPENAMCFRLERGDMLFVNNRFLCHNRTSFIDGEKPRVYVRAWINESEQV
jgi:hypothetical protein